MSTPTLFRWLAVLILAAGLVSALLVYRRPLPPDDQAILGPMSKKDLDQMERVGGKANVFTSEMSDWVRSLWRGRRLGDTLLVLTVVLSGSCFYWANFLAHPLADEERSSSDHKTG